MSKNPTVVETSWVVKLNSDDDTLVEPSRAKPRSTGIWQTGKENTIKISWSTHSLKGEAW
jgi:hypothetical protein